MMRDHEIDIAYEMIVLRGPVPPRDGEIKGGVVGVVVADLRWAKRALAGLALFILGGVGSVLTWTYLVGQEKGQERTEMRQMRREVDECIQHVRSRKWIADEPRATPDP